jgi:elongation factor G
MRQIVMTIDLQKLRNIGISAHIDSGKTTLTERILFYAGRIHKIEEVRGKSGVGATMDFMDLEREKGITIQSAATHVTWKDTPINIVDTPGHVDFTVEVERALRVLDSAILVLCSVGGVQSQTFTVDRQMKRYKVPRMAFINKMDRAGANPERVVEQLKEKLELNAWLVQIPIGSEADFEGVVDLVQQKAIYYRGEHGEQVVEEEIPSHLVEKAQIARQSLVAALADLDDQIAEKYLAEEDVSADIIRAAIRKSTIALDFTPVFIGSAFKNKGVQSLLNGVEAYLPSPLEITNMALDQNQNEEPVTLESTEKKPLVMLAFKLEDGRFGQLTFMRIYQGKVKKGDFIFNVNTDKKIKVPRLVRMHADQMEDLEEASVGDVIAMFGIDCASGDTFTDGSIRYTMATMFVPDPVISLAVAPKDRGSQANFSRALNRFSKEDPTFKVHRDAESGETIISGMGELHLEIYTERMKREFNCDVEVGQPKVNYRETITQKIDFNYTHKKQTGGQGQFARVIGYFEPLPEEESSKILEFVDETVGGSIPKQFIPACRKGFDEQMKKGLLIGAPVTGLKIVINDGLHHPVDSSEMAFKVACMTAFREFYHKAKPVLMEPIMKVGLEGPEEFQGPMMGLINQRRGIVTSSSSTGTTCQIEADVPLSEMFGFSTELRSSTQGKGEFQMTFSRYAPVPSSIQTALSEEYAKERAKGN